MPMAPSTSWAAKPTATKSRKSSTRRPFGCEGSAVSRLPARDAMLRSLAAPACGGEATWRRSLTGAARSPVARHGARAPFPPASAGRMPGQPVRSRGMPAQAPCATRRPSPGAASGTARPVRRLVGRGARLLGVHIGWNEISTRRIAARRIRLPSRLGQICQPTLERAGRARERLKEHLSLRG